MNNEEFYLRCAEILNTDHLGVPFPYYKRTRWNNRVAGQGRFEGRGIVRCFGSQVHIALTSPAVVSKIFESKEEALLFLETLW